MPYVITMVNVSLSLHPSLMLLNSVNKTKLKKKEKFNLLSKAQNGNDLILIAYAIITSQKN